MRRSVAVQRVKKTSGFWHFIMGCTPSRLIGEGQAVIAEKQNKPEELLVSTWRIYWCAVCRNEFIRFCDVQQKVDELVAKKNRSKTSKAPLDIMMGT